MKALHIRKRFILTVLCAILLIMLCAPIYSQKSSQNQGFDNAARIDIHNRRKAENSVTIIEPNLSAETKINYPSWCKSKSGQCAKIEGKVNSKWKTFVIKFKVNGDGNVTVMLRGPDVSKNGKRYPLYVDYRAVSLNQHKLLDESTSFWHDKPYKHTLKMKNGEIAELKFAARSHVLSWRELSNSVNYLLLFSVLVLSFLLSYKAVQYVSKFKLMENYSRIDIVFVVVFVALLFVPMSRISTAQKSMQENRMLAKYPQLLTKSLNLEYGRQFEKWFNDRFFGRDLLINIYSFIKMDMSRVYVNGEAKLLKSNNWMFSGSTMNMPKSPEVIAENLRKFNKIMQQEDIDFYVLFVPPKREVYHEYIADYCEDISARQEFNQWMKNMVKSKEFSVIYPYEELRHARHDDFVYFKQTHHWTDWGAYTGYKALMNAIKKDYPDIHIVSLKEYKKFKSKLLRESWSREFGCGQTTTLLKISNDYAMKHLLKDDYVYYDNKHMIIPEIVDKDYVKSKYYKNTRLKNAPRAMVIGTSQNENLMQFLPYSFSELIFYRMNNVRKVKSFEEFKILKRFHQKIADFKPDILVLSVTTSNVAFGLENMMKD